MKARNSFLITALLVLASGAAQAASVSVAFDLTGGGGDTPQLDLSSGGIDLSITADTIRNNGSLDNRASAEISRSGSGIGVKNSFLDSGQIDGFLRNDIALFSFSQEVTIESFSFSHVDGNDDFRLFGGPGFNQIGDFDLSPVFDFPTISAAMLTGDFFGLGAFGFLDNFRISGVTVSYDAVPIPAALPLMLTGMLGMGFFARRKKRLAAAA